MDNEDMQEWLAAVKITEQVGNLQKGCRYSLIEVAVIVLFFCILFWK